MAPITPAVLVPAKLAEAALELVAADDAAADAAEVPDAAREVLDKALVAHPLETIHANPDVTPVAAAVVEPVETAPAGVEALVTAGAVVGLVAAGAVPVLPEKERVWVRQLDEAIMCVRNFDQPGDYNCTNTLGWQWRVHSALPGQCCRVEWAREEYLDNVSKRACNEFWSLLACWFTSQLTDVPFCWPKSTRAWPLGSLPGVTLLCIQCTHI